MQVDYASASAPIIDQEVTQVLEDVIGGAEDLINNKTSNHINIINNTIDHIKRLKINSIWPTAFT